MTRTAPLCLEMVFQVRDLLAEYSGEVCAVAAHAIGLWLGSQLWSIFSKLASESWVPNLTYLEKGLICRAHALCNSDPFQGMSSHF